MIKLIKSTFYNEKDTRIGLIMFISQNRQLSMSEYCNDFERKFASKQGRTYAVFVNSGSSANLLLIQSLLNLGLLKTGDKVGISALTWATNVMPIIQLGLQPVLIDCEATSLNVSSMTLREKINDIKALFLTNALGFCDDIETISQMCAEKGVILLEDNCESLGSKAYGRLLGNFGLASTFSFYVGHHLSTIEGGMIATDDKELYESLLMVRAHGWSRNLSRERQEEIREKSNIKEFFDRYTFYDLAYNARPTEIQGFLGANQISYWDEIVRKREDNFKTFQAKARENNDLIQLDLNMEVVSNFAMPLVFKNKELFERYKAKFIDNGVEIRPIIAGNISEQPFFKKYVNDDSNKSPNASLVHENGFYFGNNPDMTNEEIELLCSLF